MNTNTRDVLVVGGGISGLTVAWHLRRAGRDVALLEAGPRVGGAMQTERRDGFLLEKGPFNVIVRAPEFEELLAGVAHRIRVVTAAETAKNRCLYRRGRLLAVPTGPLGLFTSPLLSKRGALRALRGLLFSRRGRAADTTIDEFAARRFGREVSETMVSAVIAGILAGDIRQLSAYDAFPVLRDFDRKSWSPLGRTLRRVPLMLRKRFNPRLRRKWKGLVSVDAGLGGLADALAVELGADCVTNCPVQRITRTGDNGFEVHTNGLPAPVAMLRCRQLVLATPAAQTAELLAPHAADAAALLNNIESAALTVINLAFRREDVQHPLDGFGFLVPQNEPEFPLMGVLWADSAFPHHAPASHRLLRVFMGGSRTPDIIAWPPERLLGTAVTALRPLLGLCGDPTLIDICAYPQAIPQYYIGHGRRIADLRRHVAGLPGLHLAGNYLDGVSINDCIKTAKAVAQRVLAAPPTAIVIPSAEVIPSAARNLPAHPDHASAAPPSAPHPSADRKAQHEHA